ncbi:MAG TPA: glycoside hydrolase family 27 protein [Clostridia bacterium]|nr:glycoside hydrolase family 27 protein [Clostridia bacterium]
MIATIMNTRLVRFFPLLLLAVACSAADLTGNWAITPPNAEGAKKLYFKLKQEGSNVTGTIRTEHVYYFVKESSPGPEDTTNLIASMIDNGNERFIQYQVKRVGDDLHIIYPRRRPNAPVRATVAKRVPDSEGAYPARLPIPAKLRQVPYNGLAKTPPMGWNSWNKFGAAIDDATIRAMADLMASNGMKEAGYQYINIDDGWASVRDAKGEIVPNKKFPDMKALADYVHSKGLKLGIYSSPGPDTCAGYEGSYGHEEQDAATFAKWGVDALKYDWCGAINIYTSDEMQAVYQKMGEALLATKRPILYSLCQYGRAEVWKWGPEVGGNLWRTTGDITDTWESMKGIGDRQNSLAQFAAPGHWNDPDMLEIGNGGMTDTEYRTHMSWWAMLAAPLLAGNDLRKMTPETLAILTNRDIIAIDQDKAGKQGARILRTGNLEVWLRELDGGERAIAIFNFGPEQGSVNVKWADLRIAKPVKGRDLWLQKDLTFGDALTATVPSHGTVMWRVK